MGRGIGSDTPTGGAQQCLCSRDSTAFAIGTGDRDNPGTRLSPEKPAQYHEHPIQAEVYLCGVYRFEVGKPLSDSGISPRRCRRLF
jgi:hypothetical protein